MQNNTLTLLVPGLLTKRFFEQRANLSLPHLSYLLSRADRETLPSEANTTPDYCGAMLEYQLCQAVGLEQPFPYAALAALGDGLAHQDDYWLYASPMSFTLGMHDACVSKPHELHLHRTQVDELVKELNTFLANDGLCLYAFQLHHWYLKVSGERPGDYAPFWSVVGKSLSKAQLSSAASAYWQRLSVELQLLLTSSSIPIANEVAARRELVSNRSVQIVHEDCEQVKQRSRSFIGDGYLSQERWPIHNLSKAQKRC